MEIQFFNKTCIITPLTPLLDNREVGRIAEKIKECGYARVGLDLSLVENCTIDFFDFIKNIDNLGVFNVQSDIFTLFNIMQYDKFINIYTTKEDFINNRFRLINRVFKPI